MRFVQAGVMLLGAAIYLFFILTAADGGGIPPEIYMEVLQWTLIGWNAALLVVTVLVIIDSVRKIRKGMTAQLATGVAVVKLALIPFFLINFILMALLALGGFALMIHGIGLALLVVVAISVVLTYLAMVSTSVYGWASVIRLRRDGRIGRGLAALYTFLLLIYVADIVAGILLFARAGRAGAFARRVWLALLVVLLETLALLAVPGYTIRELQLAWLSDIFVLVAIAAVVVAAVRLWVLRRRVQKESVAKPDEPAKVTGS